MLDGGARTAWEGPISRSATIPRKSETTRDHARGRGRTIAPKVWSGWRLFTSMVAGFAIESLGVAALRSGQFGIGSFVWQQGIRHPAAKNAP